MIKHVLFDNDGTIVDSEILAIRGTLQMLRPYGFEMAEKEYSQRFPGHLEREIVRMICEEHDFEVKDNFFEELKHLHITVFNKSLKAIAGMPTVVRSLHVPKSIVSNASLLHVNRCLKKMRLSGAIDGQIFSADQVGKPKPHPDVYQLALDTFSLAPKEAIAVEDSPTGVRAAKAAGLKVVGFLGAAHIFDGHDRILSEAGADYIVANATVLRQLFVELKVAGAR